MLQHIILAPVSCGKCHVLYYKLVVVFKLCNNATFNPILQLCLSFITFQKEISIVYSTDIVT